MIKRGQAGKIGCKAMSQKREKVRDRKTRHKPDGVTACYSMIDPRSFFDGSKKDPKPLRRIDSQRSRSGPRDPSPRDL